MFFSGCSFSFRCGWSTLSCGAEKNSYVPVGLNGDSATEVRGDSFIDVRGESPDKRAKQFYLLIFIDFIFYR